MLFRTAAQVCGAFGLWLAGPGGFSQPAAGAPPPSPYLKKAAWVETLLASRAALDAAALTESERGAWPSRLWEQIEDDFPLQWDWVLQDFGPNFPAWFNADRSTAIERELITRVLEELGDRGLLLKRELESLGRSDVSANDPRWLELYVKACEQRRARRL